MRFSLNSLYYPTHGNRNYLQFVVSFVLSLAVCLHLQQSNRPGHRSRDCGSTGKDAQPTQQTSNQQQRQSFQTDQSYESLRPFIESVRRSKNNGRLFIGVMTAQKFIDARTRHIMATWGQDAKDSLVFFSSSSSKDNYGLPVINLPTVDDSYPPQKKSFLMLKFIHDHFIDHFEWFMRADDDIFVNVPKLTSFLAQVNSSRPQLIGQMGLGKVEELGQLGLSDDDNFCMGGPGIIMSRATLRNTISHIQYCLKHLYSTHEDVEISRCFSKFVGVSCTRSYQMQSLLYHNFSGEIVWSNKLKKIMTQALTLHPIKNSPTLYDIYYHLMEMQHEAIRFEIVKDHREINKIQATFGPQLEGQPLTTAFDPLTHGNPEMIGNPVQLVSRESEAKCYKRSDLFTWDFIDRYQYTAKYLNPRRRMDGSLIPAIEANLLSIVNSINKASHLRGRIVDFKSLYYGYIRVNPLHGVTYILDILMTYRRFKGRKLTLPVRKHTYIMQTFSNPIFREVAFSSSGTDRSTTKSPTIVNLIVPLLGRVKQFSRFLVDFVNVYRQDQAINLAVVMFPDADSQNVTSRIKTTIDNLQKIQLPIQFAQLKGPFSRAAGLQRGASLFDSNSLLLLIDIDITFNEKVIEKARLNTFQGRQVYYPIVFSQYRNQFDQGDLFQTTKSRNSSSPPTKPEAFSIGSGQGYWRQFGFGIVSIYNSDLIANHGLNLDIQGWGKEDVDLYERLVKSNLTIFRAPDKDLIHIFHETECSTDLQSTQYEMCLGSKYNNLASIETMAQYIKSNNIL